MFECVCGSADLSNGAPVVNCGGRVVEVGSRGVVSALTVEKSANVGVKGDVRSGVLVLSVVVVCGVFRGLGIHTRVQSDHSSLLRHLTRLEVPAFLTNLSMHLWRNVLPAGKQPAIASCMLSFLHLGIVVHVQVESVSEQSADPTR